MKLRHLLLILTMFFSISLFADFNPFEERKIAEFNISNWYPSCVIGSNCWASYNDYEGKFFFVFKLVVEEADYGLKTNGELTFVCKKDGEKITVDIPKAIEADGETRWIRNPCLGKVKKITTKLGLDGTWGGGVVSYYVK